MHSPYVLGLMLKPSFLYPFYTHPHLLLCAMQVGMLATSNTRALQLPLLRPAQICFATSCQLLLLSVLSPYDARWHNSEPQSYQ